MEERDYRMNANSGNYDGRSRMGRMFGYEQRPMSSAPIHQDGYMSQYAGGNDVMIYSPATYEDVQLLIDHLKLREQVIVDFTAVNQASVYRILDFMSGAIYALGGSIQKITRNIFLFAPSGVTITVPPQLNRK